MLFVCQLMIMIISDDDGVNREICFNRVIRNDGDNGDSNYVDNGSDGDDGNGDGNNIDNASDGGNDDYDGGDYCYMVMPFYNAGYNRHGHNI